MVSYREIGDITPEIHQIIYDKYGLPKELFIRKAVLLSDTTGNLYIHIAYGFDDGVSTITQRVVDSIGETIRLIVEFLSDVYKNYKTAKTKVLKK